LRSRDEALAAVRERLERTAADQDPQPVLGDQALADAGALASAADPAQDFDAAEALGTFCWFRFSAQGQESGQDDLTAAACFFGPVFAADPAAVPEPLRPLYTQPGDTFDPGAAGARARALFRVHEETGELPLLWEAIMFFRAAAVATPAGDLGQAGDLSGLGGALQRVAEQTGDTGLAEKAVSVQRAALAAAPEGHPDRAAVLGHLGAALQKLAERTGTSAPLREAVRICRAGVAAAPPGDPYHALCLCNLGNALCGLAGHTGNLGPLEQAVAAHRAAVRGTSAGDSLRPGRLANLGTSLENLFERTGRLAPLREAAEAIAAAAGAVPPGHRARAGYLSNLGAVQQRLFDRTMDTTWLDDAVRTHRAALTATSGDDPDRGRRLSNLGTALRTLALRTRNLSLLTEAVRAHRAAVAAAPADDPNLARYLSNLGLAQQSLAELTGDPGILGQAVQTHRAAVAAAPAGHPDHPATLASLAGALQLQASRLAEARARADALAEAVRAGRAAVAGIPAGHPDRAMYLDNLGTALRALSQQTGDASALAEAGRCLARAAGDEAAPAAVRVSAYRGLARLPGRGGQSAKQALQAMETAAALLPQVAPHALTPADRQYSLSRLASIAGLAAAAAVSAGHPGRAVELLEQTRGILAGVTLDARSGDLAQLRRQAPRLAREFEDLRARIDSPGHPDHVTGRPGAPAGPQTRARLRRDTGAAWDGLLSRIRAVSGFETFLRAPGLDQLAAQAQPGPVIIPYTSPSRCDALILTGDPARPVRVVPLTGLTEDDAARQASRLLRARQAATSNDASLRERSAANGEILQVLGWLWDTVTGPVLTSLRHTRTPAAGQAWPRVWWCPVGILGYLPLHAAGHHGDAPPARRTVPDRVVSSYTTTIRGLAYARSQQPAAPGGATLIIAAPAAAGAPSLGGVTREAGVLTHLIPGARLLAGPTREKILRRLARYPLAHFACHGCADWADPAASWLAVPSTGDRRLTVADISALNLTGSLAYLSACDTTVTSPALADEAVHITGAFHLAGYAHVIGTLWPIDDSTGSDLACGFYRRLTGGGATPPEPGSAAHALHQVTRELRDQYPGQPALWAAHTHTGT
jgi:hypothetical protein